MHWSIPSGNTDVYEKPLTLFRPNVFKNGLFFNRREDTVSNGYDASLTLTSVLPDGLDQLLPKNE